MANSSTSVYKPLVSVVIRTYNEARYLDELLTAVQKQCRENFDLEIILVDSGSQDGTLDIARRNDVNIVSIKKKDFTFGRSLNVGCSAAKGEFFVFISGHCIPISPTWIYELIQPLVSGLAHCSYGRQVGRGPSKFSEMQLFAKYFPAYSKVAQEGFFCNNANAAITREVWERFGYNEELTGLEDMYLGRQIYESGGTIAYIATAGVFHIHDESWKQICVRYEREALALQQILPNVHFGFLDFFAYASVAVAGDFRVAINQKKIVKEFFGIVCFRIMQYWGTYKGSVRHRVISDAVKHSYFYPKDLEKEKYVKDESSRVAAHEGQQ